ncbi:uncharacterized protein N7482_001256 [Penicillium canariense]|uniref:Uncharacterized protein n=1 Tax=Penicillium canariense TaxID=189055 RepID=A0A9W9IFP3_9EURO|nr:uncharacterized protein N7482_001256 [Penicillium canariense]KAJ5175379.1 hypothetical protein N7482_001256 [Penicillium canariense]
MGSYKSHQVRTGSGGSSSSTDTAASDRSRSTAPTLLSERTMPGPKCRDWPESEYMDEISVSVAEEEEEGEGEEGEEEEEQQEDNDIRESVSTYASTTHSKARIAPEEPVFEVDDREESFPTDAVASTPTSFANLFPSTRRLLIRHDDATVDGNMNLRVDTVVPCRDGYQQDVILFHLRMYDLFSRKCSFRRYCRDSGREVCHSTRKETSPPHDHRPVFRRSWSSMLASLRASSSGSSSHHGQAPVTDHLKRQDSGYSTGKHAHSCDPNGLADDSAENTSSPSASSSSHDKHLTDTILLEFSNYAHVELKRRGSPGAKRYEYEYWSTRYQWRCECRREGDLREFSYHLVDTRSSRTIAHMVPDILTPLEAVDEESKGGWVPPSSLWISDPAVYERMPDVADVIVATGLFTLVDDCIRRRWHTERRGSRILPARSSLSQSLERMGPRRLIGEVLQRRGSA